MSSRWNDIFREFVRKELNGEINGRNRRTSTPSKGGSAQKPNHRAGGSGSQGSSQRAKWSVYTSTDTREGSRIITPDLDINDPYYNLDLQMKYLRACPEVFYVKPSVMLERRRRNKWAPPWMSGELGQPNNAKTWTPRKVGHMQSDAVMAGEIIGWRGWHWNGKRLRSIFVDYEWPTNGKHATGEPNRGYGIHAYMDRKRVYIEYQNILEDIFIGEVAMWGDVIVFESGYTAEFGRVVSLEPCHKSQYKIIDKVKELYAIE